MQAAAVLLAFPALPHKICFVGPRCCQKCMVNLPELRSVISYVCGGHSDSILLEVKASSLLDLLEDSSSQGIPRHSLAAQFLTLKGVRGLLVST